MTTKFGEIKIVCDENPIGIILREDKNGVVLEEHFDEEGQRVDVIHQFDEDFTILNPQCLKECLEEARRYVPDLNVPIFIRKIVKTDEEKKKEEEEKKAYFMRLAESSQLRPWNYFSGPTT